MIFITYNVYGVPFGNTTAQMGGWFRKEIKTVDDLKGLKFRVGGVAGQVLSRLGVVPQQLPPADIYPALEKGAIDAAEWIGPYDDEKAGVREDRALLLLSRLVGGLRQWLPLHQQRQMGRATQSLSTNGVDGCGALAADLIAKYDSRNPPSIKRLVAAGAQLRPFSLDILDACYKASQELFAEVAAKNAVFKKLYDSTTAFRNDQYAWHQICETTYDAYMIRQRSRT